VSPLCSPSVRPAIWCHHRCADAEWAGQDGPCHVCLTRLTGTPLAFVANMKMCAGRLWRQIADAPQPSASALSRARQAVSSATPTRLAAAFRTLLLVISLLYVCFFGSPNYTPACQSKADMLAFIGTLSEGCLSKLYAETLYCITCCCHTACCTGQAARMPPAQPPQPTSPSAQGGPVLTQQGGASPPPPAFRLALPPPPPAAPKAKPSAPPAASPTSSPTAPPQPAKVAPMAPPTAAPTAAPPPSKPSAPPKTVAVKPTAKQSPAPTAPPLAPTASKQSRYTVRPGWAIKLV
jgi:hypothetical protein